MPLRPLILPAEVGQLARPCYADEALLTQIIAESEREDIRPRIGATLFIALKSTESDADLTGSLRILLLGGEWTDNSGRMHYLDGIKVALAYYTYGRVIRDGNITSTRYGAVIKSDDNSNSASDNAERQRQYRQAFDTADTMIVEAVNYITAMKVGGYEDCPGIRSNRAKMSVIGNHSAACGCESERTTIISGKEGPSAYDVAVANGFRGSVEDWLASLVGPQGPEGPQGPQGPSISLDNYYDKTEVDALLADKASASDVEDAISEEAAARENGDQSLGTQIVTLENNIGESIGNIEDKVDDVSASLAVVQSNLETEQAARVAADASLGARISDEEAARKSSDDSLSASIADEATKRRSEDSRIEGLIGIERNERAAADAALELSKQDAIHDLETIRSNAQNASDTIASMIESGYLFAGVATLDPATEPGTPDAKVFYIANGKGTYTNFGGIEVTEDDVVVLYWDTAWHKVATGIASQAKLSELDDGMENIVGRESITLNLTDYESEGGFIIQSTGKWGSSTDATTYSHKCIRIPRVKQITIKGHATAISVIAFMTSNVVSPSQNADLAGGFVLSLNPFSLSANEEFTANVPEGTLYLYVSHLIGGENRLPQSVILQGKEGELDRIKARLDTAESDIKGLKEAVDASIISLDSYENGRRDLTCRDIQMPIFDYNIVIGYGQSLAYGNSVFGSAFSCYKNCVELKSGDFVIKTFTPEGEYNIGRIPPSDIAANSLAYVLGGYSPDKKVVCVNKSKGDKSIAQLMDGNRYGNGGSATSVFDFSGIDYSANNWYQSMITALNSCRTKAVAEGKTIGVVAFIFAQGENDETTTRTGDYNCNGDGGEWKKRVKQLKADIFADINTIFGQERNPAFLIGNLSDKWAVYGNIWNAINELPNEDKDIILCSPKYAMPNLGVKEGTSLFDGHLSANGYVWWGEYIGNNLVDLFFHHSMPNIMRISKAIKVGNKEVIVSFGATKLPVQIDTYTTQEMKGYGFSILDSEGVNIGELGVTLYSNGTISLICENDIPEGAVLCYGMTEAVSHSHMPCAGNIKDSAEGISYFNYMHDLPWHDASGTWNLDFVPKDIDGNSLEGKKYPMNNWLCPEKVPIVGAEAPKPKEWIEIPLTFNNDDVNDFKAYFTANTGIVKSYHTNYYITKNATPVKVGDKIRFSIEIVSAGAVAFSSSNSIVEIGQTWTLLEQIVSGRKVYQDVEITIQNDGFVAFGYLSAPDAKTIPNPTAYIQK